MTSMRKQSSTNFQNEIKIMEDCPIYKTIYLISARWKAHVIWFLKDRPLRFGEIVNSIPLATERMIALRIQDLLKDQLIERLEKANHIFYRLTGRGKKLVPVLHELFRVGKQIAAS
ncbi:MAG: helix-turn-helix domain-containing protein [Bacteriovoracaceae bacterium]|nr:helix-turn-helix domain-containing protein [Bacteriovoracaceae bacterium]